VSPLTHPVVGLIRMTQLFVREMKKQDSGVRGFICTGGGESGLRGD
jgi:hypothetical protein